MLRDEPSKDSISKGLANIMRSAGVHPSLIHAFLKTGLLVGEDSPHTPEERKEFADAVDEWYDLKQKGGKK
jgi:hypothetical protein